MLSSRVLLTTNYNHYRLSRIRGLGRGNGLVMSWALDSALILAYFINNAMIQ